MIKDAILDDVPVLASLIIDFCKEVGLEYHPKAIASLVVMAITHSNYYCRLSYHEQDPVGCFIGFLNTDVYDHSLFAQDQLIYVRPEFRNKEHSHQLYNNFLAWAKDKHCKTVVFHALCAKDNEQFAHILERIHCSRKGVIMSRNL